MRTYLTALLVSAIALHAAPAPAIKPSPARPSAAKVVSTNPPPTALLSPHVIKLDNGVTVVVASTNQLTVAEVRRCLREAFLKVR